MTVCLTGKGPRNQGLTRGGARNTASLHGHRFAAKQSTPDEEIYAEPKSDDDDLIFQREAAAAQQEFVTQDVSTIGPQRPSRSRLLRKDTDVVGHGSKHDDARRSSRERDSKKMDDGSMGDMDPFQSNKRTKVLYGSQRSTSNIHAGSSNRPDKASSQPTPSSTKRSPGQSVYRKPPDAPVKPSRKVVSQLGLKHS